MTASSTASSTMPLDFVGGMMNAFATRIGRFSFFGLPGTASSTDASNTPETASSTPIDSYASGLMHAIFAKMTEWLADATNEIVNLSAKNLYAENSTAKRGSFQQLTASSTISDETLTDKLCVGSTCITESQFMAVFGAAAAATLPISVISPPTEIRDAPATTTPSDLTNSEQSPHEKSTTTPVETGPANDNDPAFVPANDNPLPADTATGF